MGLIDSYNYILNNFINDLAEESDNKDSKNVMDKGKAENYSNKSSDSNNTDDNNFKDGDSSNNNKGNKACGYAGRQKLPTPITS